MIELLIAIFIIAISLIAIYGVTQTILSGARVSIFRFKATYLAQEGIEIIRNIRDNNIISGNDWNAGFNLCNPHYNLFCEADYNDLSLSPYASPNEPRKLLFPGIFYNYSEGKPTNFTRKITIDPVSEDRADVLVEVIWEDGDQEYNISLKTSLYDWQ